MKNSVLTQTLDKLFDNRLHSDELYVPTAQDIRRIFYVFNRCVFGGRLDQHSKLIVTTKANAAARPELRYTKALFAFGKTRSVPNCMIVVRDDISDTFFSICNSVAHEMIHMYDFEYGPLRKMFERFGECVAEPGFSADGTVTQIVRDMTGSENYDVHGEYFAKYMNKINSYGFDVCRVRDPFTKRRRTIDESKINPASSFADFITDDYAAAHWVSPDDWFVELI